MTWNSEQFFEAVESRRSFYALTPETTIPDEHIQKLVERAVKHSPTSFNMQQERAVVVTGELHKKIWDIIKDVKIQGQQPDHAAATEARMGAFKSGYGTILVFSDYAVVEAWGEKMPFAKDAFKTFTQHAAGILHYILWTSLEKEGLGASLQHTAEGSDEIQAGLRKLLNLPDSWVNSALIPFGTPAAAPNAKEFAPIEDRVKVFFDKQ